jgi:hypothetical protein
VTPELAARLQSRDFRYFENEKGFCFVVRDNCMAVISGNSAGSSSIATEAGFAFLVWRAGQPYLASHGSLDIQATPEQVETLRQFSQDLKAALTP